MVFIKICFPPNTASTETFKVELKSSISEIKNSVKQGENLKNYDFFYCGKKLADDITLENVQTINDNSTVFAFRKPTYASLQPDPPTALQLESLLSSLQATLMEPHHRALLNRITANPETLQNLIDCVPGLRQDTVAQAVVKDPFLLHHWVDDENAPQNFVKHPSLFLACQHIVEHLHAEVIRHSGSANEAPMLFPPPPPDVAVGDPFEDDDEEGDEGANGQNAMNAAMANPAFRQQITAQHLASALAAAAAAGGFPAAVNRPSTSNINQPSAPASAPAPAPAPAPASHQQAFVTPDMFRQAIQQAFQPPPHPTVQQPVARQVNYEEQLTGLRDMGFTNEEENMRALRACNGDFQAALEFIINERERQEQGFGLD